MRSGSLHPHRIDDDCKTGYKENNRPREKKAHQNAFGISSESTKRNMNFPYVINSWNDESGFKINHHFLEV